MPLLGACCRDFRFAVRRLVAAPSFLVPVVLTIAIGVAAASSIFALVNGILLRPLSYPDADRIVAIEHIAPRRALTLESHSQRLYSHYEHENRTLEATGAYLQNVVNLTDRDAPEQVDMAMITPGAFTALSATPHLGRLFTESEGRLGAPTYVILSYGLWVSRYGSDAAIVGKHIEINGRPREIIGVATQGFAFPGRDVKLWYNLSPEPSERISDMHLRVVAKVRGGLALPDVRRDLQGSLRALTESVNSSDREFLSDLQVQVVPLKDKLVGNLRSALLTLLAAAGLLLFVACGGVVNLFLVRFERQQHAAAVRTALGARRSDIASVWLTETVVATSLAGLLGAAVTALLLRARFGFQPGDIPRLEETRFDWATAAFVVSLLAAVWLLIAGTLALRGRRAGQPSPLAAERIGDAQPARQRTQRALVGLQIALALTSLLACVTAVRGFQRLLDVRHGFVADGVVTQKVTLPFRQYSGYARTAAFHHDLLARIGRAPGVVSAGSVSRLPVMPPPVETERQLILSSARTSGAAGDANLSADFLLATPAYFDAMRIPVLAGKLFGASDAGAEIPVMVSRTLARRLADDLNAAPGQTLREARSGASGLVVVGVVEDTVGENLVAPPRNVLYLPVVEGLPSNLRVPLIASQMAIVVRSAVDPLSAAGYVREAVRAIDPKLPVADVRPMTARVEGARAHLRLAAILLSVAATATLFLGIIGTYGVSSYAVSRRLREFGIRLALGATPSRIHRLVLGELVVVLAAGIGTGLAVFVGLGNVWQGIAVGVEPADGVWIALSIAVIAIAALAAGAVPAMRAGRANPVDAVKAL